MFIFFLCYPSSNLVQAKEIKTENIINLTEI